MQSDRNLLFGLLALQCGFISKDQMVAALAAWSSDKQKSIEAIFVEQNALTPYQLALLAQLEEELLAQHSQSAEQSLAVLSSIGSVRQEIEGLADAQLNATLAHVAKNPEDTSAFGVKDSAKHTRRDGALRYRTIRLHAKGGLGEVFVAKDEELNREVALKEIQEKFADHDESRARFKLEAEITGNLEHPGIVPVYGLGQYEDGRPYYAMRFIRGDSLKEAIDAFHAKHKSNLTDGDAGLELRKLLRRFVDVCNAMAYAHSRGVLHRDLKPGNIILGKYGETLVVDWGLAKAQGQSESTDTSIGAVTPSSGSGATPTMVGSAVGTPAYMSPEQAAGKVNELNAATDVYSLGATLFHLLTGQLPIAGKTPIEIVRKAESGEIRRPRELRADVPKSLEAVCLKAMAKEPTQRYASPVALADDVEKWLADEPVSAMAEPVLVSARRWMRKHPAIVSTSAACVVLGLCAASIVAYLQNAHATELAGKNVELTTAKNKAESAAKAEGIAKVDAQDKQKLAETERARAEQREQEAIDAVKRFGDAVAGNSELKNSERLKSLRKELLKEPLGFFKLLRERLHFEKNTSKESLTRLATAAFDLGKLTDEIGDKQDAIIAFKEALAIHDRLTQEGSSDSKVVEAQAIVHNRLALLFQKTGRPEEALVAYTQSCALLEKLVRENPSVVEFQKKLALGQQNLGLQLQATGKLSEAMSALEQTTTILEHLSKEHPTDAGLQCDVARSFDNLANLLGVIGKPVAANVAYSQAQRIFERVVRDNSSVTEYQLELAVNRKNHGGLLRATGKPDEAIAAYGQAKSILEQLARDQPAVTQFQNDLAETHDELGLLLRAIGKPTEALATHEQAKAIYERLARENPSVVDYQRGLAKNYSRLGMLLSDAGNLVGAISAYEQAKTIEENIALSDPSNFIAWSGVATEYSNIGTLLLRNNKPLEAQTSFEKARAILERLIREYPTVHLYHSNFGGTLNNIAVIQLQESKFAEARDLLLKAIESQKLALGSNPNQAIYRQFLKNHYTALRMAAKGLGDASLAEEAQKGLLELATNDPRFAEINQRLAAVANGEPAKDINELIGLGQRASDLQKFALAARIYGDAINQVASVAENRQLQVLYNAACSAALAASGQGEGADKLDGAFKAKLRSQALGWLKSELTQWEKAMEKPEAKSAVAATLKHWQGDSDLASVREAAEIEKSPVAERKEWEALWTRVKEMHDKASAENKPEGK